MTPFIQVKLNEAELVSAKAALYEYSRRLPSGERKERARALAQRFQAAAELIGDSDGRRVL